MFDIAWSEFLVVAVVALVVVGPRDLPALLRTVGKTVASLRRVAAEFQSQFHEAMREAELDDIKKEVTGLKDAASKVVGASPFQVARDEIRSAIESKPSALAGDPAKVDAGAPSALAPDVTPVKLNGAAHEHAGGARASTAKAEPSATTSAASETNAPELLASASGEGGGAKPNPGSPGAPA